MQFDVAGELKYELHYYLDLPNHILQTEFERSRVSDNFYSSHSMTGGMRLYNQYERVYQRTYRPEQAVLEILATEARLTKQIERDTDRLRLFTEEFNPNQIERLRKDISLPNMTKLERKACSYIKEIETYLHYMNHGKSFDDEDGIEAESEEFDELLEGLMDDTGRTILL